MWLTKNTGKERFHKRRTIRQGKAPSDRVKSGLTRRNPCYHNSTENRNSHKKTRRSGMIFLFLSGEVYENRYIHCRKIGQLILSVFVMSLIVFFVSRLAPGNPLRAYYGEAIERMSREQLQNAEHRLGLDDSLITQYFRWLGNALHGDFGISYQYKQPAIDVIGQVWSNTAWLTGVSMVLIFVIGILTAVFCVRREGKLADRVMCRIGVAAGNVPEFFVALILILIFSVTLSWLPQSGSGTIGETGPADRLLHLILPVASIVISHFWYCGYLIRTDFPKNRQGICRGAKSRAQRNSHITALLKNIIVDNKHNGNFPAPPAGGAYVVEIVFPTRAWESWGWRAPAIMITTC